MKFFSIKCWGILLIVSIFLSTHGYCNKQDSLINVIKVTTDNIKKINLLTELIKVYKENGNYEQAIKAASECLNIAKWENYSEGIISSYRNLGYAYYYYNNNIKALENYLSAIRYLDNTSNYLLLAKTYQNIAIIYNLLKNYNEAIRYNKLCLINLKKQPNEDVLLNCYINYSNSYGLLNDHKRQINYLKKVIEIRKDKRQYSQIGMEYNNLGKAFWKIKKYDSAMTYFEKFQILSIQFNDTLEIARSFINIGGAFYSKGEYPKSLYFLNKSLEFNTPLKDYACLQLVYVNLKLKNIEQANYFYNLARNGNSDLYDLAQVGDSIRSYFEKNGNLEKAYYYSKITNNLKDSLSALAKVDIESTVKMKYEVEGLEARLAEKENYELMQENLALRSEQNRFLIIILVLLFIIGAGGIYLVRRRLMQKEKRLVFVEEGVAEIGKCLEDIKALRSEKKAFL
ncbi:MAG TPA: tetratricopeptide repeat protein [Cytophagales bacterium]|nr:tetratricopeptide repeat protein [Cytophagales bacterium]